MQLALIIIVLTVVCIAAQASLGAEEAIERLNLEAQQPASEAHDTNVGVSTQQTEPTPLTSEGPNTPQRAETEPVRRVQPLARAREPDALEMYAAPEMQEIAEASAYGERAPPTETDELPATQMLPRGGGEREQPLTPPMRPPPRGIQMSPAGIMDFMDVPPVPHEEPLPGPMAAPVVVHGSAFSSGGQNHGVGGAGGFITDMPVTGGFAGIPSEGHGGRS